MKHTFGRGLPQAPGQLPWPCAQDPVWWSQSLGSPQHQASPCNSKLQMDYCKPILQSCPAPVRFLQPQAHPSARPTPWASGSREPPYTSTLFQPPQTHASSLPWETQASGTKVPSQHQASPHIQAQNPPITMSVPINPGTGPLTCWPRPLTSSPKDSTHSRKPTHRHNQSAQDLWTGRLVQGFPCQSQSVKLWRHQCNTTNNQGNMIPSEVQNKSPVTNLKEIETWELPHKNSK